MAVQSLYEAAGGMETCRKLSEVFYARVAQDPVLRPLFPSKHFRCAIEAFTDFLAQLLGGPNEYSRNHWWLSLRESHLRFKIGPKERNAWIRTMRKSLDDVQISEPARSALRWFFEQSSAYLVNQGKAPVAGNAPPMDHLHQEIARQWELRRSIDEAVTAVRNRDANRAIELAESCFGDDRAGLLALLALMSGSRDAAMLRYVRKTLLVDPTLAQDRYSRGRTLLHGAAGAGGLLTVRLLLELGADPNAIDEGGHAPLYCVGNECAAETGGDIVRVLVEHGANVNANGGGQRCTALHMAARRGNVQVAEALLDCGADPVAHDTRGDTPLTRAINCRKPAVAAFLRSRTQS